MAISMETASNIGDFATLSRLIRTASGSYQPLPPVIRNDSNGLIGEQDAEVQRWVDYFTAVLNRPSPTWFCSFIRATVSYESACEPPDKEEICGVLCTLKLNKSPGEDGIPPKLIKMCQEAFIDPFTILFTHHLGERNLPH